MILFDDPYDLEYARYADALSRSARDTLLWLQVHLPAGWTTEQHRHWVQTGEEPEVSQ